MTRAGTLALRRGMWRVAAMPELPDLYSPRWILLTSIVSRTLQRNVSPVSGLQLSWRFAAHSDVLEARFSLKTESIGTSRQPSKSP